MRIVFWGTPEFALPSLRALLGEGHEVVAVVTQPDRPAGRGRVVQASPIKREAEEEAIPVFQPEKPVGNEFLAALGALSPDLSVVVAYGQILKRAVLDVPRLGSINVHASLLPALRGAAPINWALANGDEFTGVSIMRMVEKMDAGPILMQVAEPIEADETATDLSARLSELGAEVLIETLMLLESGQITETEQDDAHSTIAPRITRGHTHIDWTLDCAAVGRGIRAFDAEPGAWTTLRGSELKLYRPLPDAQWVHVAPPGTVLEVHESDASEGMLVACGTGAVWIREVKAAGKRRMTSAEWARGRTVEAGDRLT